VVALFQFLWRDRHTHTWRQSHRLTISILSAERRSIFRNKIDRVQLIKLVLMSVHCAFTRLSVHQVFPNPYDI